MEIPTTITTRSKDKIPVKAQCKCGIVTVKK